jgi:tripartite-type tricarboxylate transporter receptor subunit TctC
MIRRRDVLTLTLGYLLAKGPMPHSAGAMTIYPDHPIRLVVPFAPGGPNDVLARLWADKMKALLGLVVIENQGGAGGLLGGVTVARAEPDGYTILLGGTGSQIIVPAMTTHVPYDSAKDLEPISMLVIAALGIVVHPSVPAQNLQELIDYAKANPGKLSYGTAGFGTVAHLTGESLKSQTGATDIVHVPYKGVGPSIADLISGQLPMVIATVNRQMIDLQQSGKVRLLAVTTRDRIAAAPDVPSIVEAGWPDLVAQVFFGLFAPAATPKEIIARIAHATRTAMVDEEFRGRLIAGGLEPYPDSSPQAARALFEDEVRRWAPAIKALGPKLERSGTRP